MKLGTGVIGGLNTRLVFCDSAHNLPVNMATQTVNGMSFGQPHVKRRVFVGLAVVTATGVEPTVMTIGGVSATKHVGFARFGLYSLTSQIWSAPVPTGTTGTVQFSVPSNDIDGGSVYVWAGYDQSSPLALATRTADDLGSPSSDLSVDVAGGGFAIAVAISDHNLVWTFSFSSLTIDDADLVPNFASAGASVSKAVSGAPRSIIATRTSTLGTFGVTGVAASFR